jgi:N-acetylglutamate synthase-like GNAT family acetyltransferase
LLVKAGYDTRMKNNRDHGDYSISTDAGRLDIAFIHDFLSTKSYWAQGRSRETVSRSVQNSVCFGVYASDGRQVGFARLVTDRATFAWVCDVFIDEAHRGKGLGKRLVEAVVSHPCLKGLKKVVLGTRDAHELYRRHGGFKSLETPERWMERPGS